MPHQRWRRTEKNTGAPIIFSSLSLGLTCAMQARRWCVYRDTPIGESLRSRSCLPHRRVGRQAGGAGTRSPGGEDRADADSAVVSPNLRIKQSLREGRTAEIFPAEVSVVSRLKAGLPPPSHTRHGQTPISPAHLPPTCAATTSNATELPADQSAPRGSANGRRERPKTQGDTWSGWGDIINDRGGVWGGTEVSPPKLTGVLGCLRDTIGGNRLVSCLAPPLASSACSPGYPPGAHPSVLEDWFARGRRETRSGRCSRARAAHATCPQLVSAGGVRAPPALTVVGGT